MPYVSQDDLEKAVQFGLFVDSQSSDKSRSPIDVVNLLGKTFSGKRVDLALSSLERSGAIDGAHGYTGSGFSISEKGYRAIEKALEDPASFFSQLQRGGIEWLVSDGVREAPASDRVVRFDHNQPEALEITRGIVATKESVRGANDEGIDEEERQRVLRSLDAAESFWNSANLKVIQLKIGVLMAVEDAGRLLKATSKAVAIDVLVEAIKAFARNFLRVDLDV